MTASENQSVAVDDDVFEIVGDEIVEEAAGEDDEQSRQQAVEGDLSEQLGGEFVASMAALVRRESHERS